MAGKYNYRTMELGVRRCKQIMLKMRTIALFGAMLFALPVAALQLGPLQIRSDFGQPLAAYIEVADSGKVSPRRLQLQFYDYRNPNRAVQMERVLVLSRLHYEIVRPQKGGNLFVHLYTQEPLEEVRISFSMRVQARRVGSSERKYLHILPGTQVAGSDGAVRDRRRSRRTLSRRRDQGWQLGMAAPEAGLYVSSNDYHALWVMAQQLKSGYGISAFQAMLAIFDINRHAFGQDSTGNRNINLLWAGKELRMPTLDEMRSYDRSSSVVEVARQNYYAEVAPLDEVALRQILTLSAPEDTEILAGGMRDEDSEEQWGGYDRPVLLEEEQEGSDEAGVDWGSPLQPEEGLPEEEEALGLWVWLLIAGALVLIVVLLRVFRGMGSSSASVAEEDLNIPDQIALLRAHTDMKDEIAAQRLYKRIIASANLSHDHRRQADELIARLKEE